MSERLKKVNSLIKRIVSEIISTELDFKISSYFYTVTEVRATEDLQEANVYISILGGENKNTEGFNQLCKRLWKIQKLFAGRIHLKYTPKLHLLIDETSDYAFRINELINKIHVDEPKP